MKLAISYLERADNMQYYEAKLDISILYKVLSNMYHNDGGRVVSDKWKKINNWREP